MSSLVSATWLPDLEMPLDEAAALYAANGWPVFPCSGKVPLTKRGFYDATAAPESVAATWTANPTANIATPAGGPRRWLVVDVDGDVGKQSLGGLQRQHGPLPWRLRQTTGKGGEHWIFIAPEGIAFSNRVRFAPGLDVRAEGGYIVVAPSVHPETGVLYSWHSCIEPAPLPAWLAEKLAPKKPEAPQRPYVPPRNEHERTRRERYAHAALAGLAEDVRSAGKGTRNDVLNRAWYRAAQFRDVIGQTEARAYLLPAALTVGLSEREAMQVLR